jgi:vesicle-associated membrane protein 7
MGRRLPFAFLSEIQKKVSRAASLPGKEADLTSPFCIATILQFSSTFDPALVSNPRPSDFAAFKSTLASTMNRFNTQPQSDPVKAAQSELAGVKDIMTQNVEQILNRGERLDLLMNRTDQAANQSMAFRRRAVGLRR